MTPALYQILFRQRRVTRPGAFDTMQALQAAYALYGVQQLVTSATYTGYAYRALRTSDSATMDFLPNTTSLQLAAWGQAAGAAHIYGIIWYDQSGNGNTSDTLTSGNAGQAPEFDCSVSTYPVAVFNGTTSRIGWTGAGGSNMRNINTTALGITLACSVLPTAAPAATQFAMITSTASSTVRRVSLDFQTQPSIVATMTRVDGGSATASSVPLTWSLVTPYIAMAVVDYPGGTIKRYLNGTAATQGTFTALPSPAFVQSAVVGIGACSSNFAAMRGTVWAFYNVAVSANIATLEAALEAAA